MKDSPFIYGTTVSTQSFTNREAEAAKLRSNLLNGINTTIISPRRWGKSSLVEKVVADIKRKNTKNKTVVIDLFAISNEEEFLEIYAREVIKASSTKWQEWMNSSKDFFKKIIPKLSFGVDPSADFTLSFDRHELKKHSDEVLNLPETIATKKGVKFIICLDEFQNLASFNDYSIFEKKLRACWQRHKSVTYCLYGSKRHMMTDIFNNPSKPFYRFGDIMLLQKIQTTKWVSFITESFKNTGRQIDATTAEAIPIVMKNHSWYVQQLAHYVWNLTQRKASLVELNAALNELIQANSPLYQKEIEILSATQINFLKAVVRGETKFTSAAVMQKHLLGTPRNVSKNKSILINNDIIHEVNQHYEFVDPAFELWFKKQFFNQPYQVTR
jgi:hypothetical protein